MVDEISEPYGSHVFIRSRIVYRGRDEPRTIEEARERAEVFARRLSDSFEHGIDGARVSVKTLYARPGSLLAGHLAHFQFNNVEDWEAHRKLFTDYAEDVERWIVAEWAASVGAGFVYGDIRISNGKSPPSEAAPTTEHARAHTNIDFKELLASRDRMIWTAFGIGIFLAVTSSAAFWASSNLADRMGKIEAKYAQPDHMERPEPTIVVVTPSSSPALQTVRKVASDQQKACPACPVVLRIQAPER